MKRIRITGVICVVSVALWTQSSFANAVETMLGVRLSHFQCQACSMREFSNRLVSDAGLSVGIEEFWNGTASHTLNIDAHDVTARELLDMAIVKLPEYVWLPAGKNTVNILPASEAADVHSRWNTHVTYQPGGPTSLRDAISIVLNLSYQTVRPITGTVGGGPMPPNPKIQVSFDNKPYLQVMNGIFQAAGGQFHWSATKFFTYGYGYEKFSKVDTTLHRQALSAVKDKLGDTTIRTRFVSALSEVPPGQTRNQIALDYADYLFSQNDFPKTLAVLFEIMPSVLRSENSNDINVRTIGRYIDVLQQQDRIAEAETYLVHRYKDDAFAAKVLARQQIADILLRLFPPHATTQDNLRMLTARRTLFPDDGDYQWRLQERIDLLEKAIESEENQKQ